jgi:hydroxymethylpyrimidine pyrophosphatase-like HAD family hydrolase
MDGGGEGDGVQLDVFEMEAWGDPAPRLITVLPTRAGKGNAALYVLDKLGIPVEDAVCAGDTFGDEPILRTGIRCVCVGTCGNINHSLSRFTSIRLLGGMSKPLD